MKLSEAMRLGTMLGPQAVGRFDSTRRKYVFFGPVVKEYCALGGAYAANGAGWEEQVHAFDSDTFRGRVKAGEKSKAYETPWEWQLVFSVSRACPQCEQVHSMKQLIPHLNDVHQWRREDIARVVEEVEQIVTEREAVFSVQI